MNVLRTGCIVFLVLLALLSCIACDVRTTAQLPTMLDNRIVGEWHDLSNKGNLTIIRPSGNGYIMGTPDDYIKGESALQHFTLANVGRKIIVEVSASSTSLCAEFHPSVSGCYLLMGTLQIGEDDLIIRQSDSARLVQNSVAGLISIPHAIHRVQRANGVENSLFFDVPPMELSKFLASDAFAVKSEGAGHFQRVR